MAHILMSRKTESSYTAVLRVLKTTVINDHSPAVVMTDFEQALRNASRTVFPHAIVAGCSVHYDRVSVNNQCYSIKKFMNFLTYKYFHSLGHT